MLGDNSRLAGGIRAELTRRGILMLNLTSAPGSGKTALLHATLSAEEGGRSAVLVGDLETDRDAARLRGLGAQVLQINTGRGCHLSGGPGLGRAGPAEPGGPGVRVRRERGQHGLPLGL